MGGTGEPIRQGSATAVVDEGPVSGSEDLVPSVTDKREAAKRDRSFSNGCADDPSGLLLHRG
jgi:hypothetical protein